MLHIREEIKWQREGRVHSRSEKNNGISIFLDEEARVQPRRSKGSYEMSELGFPTFFLMWTWVPLNTPAREFPGGLVVKTRHLHHCNQGSIPGLETEIPHQATACCSQKLKRKSSSKKKKILKKIPRTHFQLEKRWGVSSGNSSALSREGVLAVGKKGTWEGHPGTGNQC